MYNVIIIYPYCSYAPPDKTISGCVCIFTNKEHAPVPALQG